MASDFAISAASANIKIPRLDSVSVGSELGKTLNEAFNVVAGNSLCANEDNVFETMNQNIHILIPITMHIPIPEPKAAPPATSYSQMIFY